MMVTCTLTTITTPTAADYCKLVLERFAPRLLGTDTIVYVVSFSQIRKRLGGGFRGVWSPLLFCQVEPLLQAEGRHRGAGKAIAVDDGYGFHTAAAIFLHELAHVAEALIEDLQPREPIAVDPEAMARVKAYLATAPITYTPRADAPLWYDHGDGFIRLALHLVHRARLAGFRINTSEVCVAGRRYGLSPSRDYELALAAELADFDPEAPITELASIEPPAEFVELWKADTTP